MPPSSADNRSIALGRATEAACQLLTCSISISLHNLAMAPEFLIRAALVTVIPFAIYVPTAPAPAAYMSAHTYEQYIPIY